MRGQCVTMMRIETRSLELVIGRSFVKKYGIKMKNFQIRDGKMCSFAFIFLLNDAGKQKREPKRPKSELSKLKLT